MHRRTPLGLSDDNVLPQDGIAPSAGSQLPGPTGIATDELSKGSALSGSVSPAFKVGTDTYRLRRAGTKSPADSHEERIPPSEARPIIEQAVVHHRDNVPLLRLLETALRL